MRWRPTGCAPRVCRARAGALRRIDPPLLLLLAVGIAGFLLLPVLTLAPNRLLSGAPVPLAGAVWLAVPCLACGLGAVGGARRGSLLVAAGAWLLIGALGALAGRGAADALAGAPPAARVSLGGGFWVAMVAALLLWSEAMRRALPRAAGLALAGVLPLLLLWWAGVLAPLSLAREYAVRRADVAAALLTHVGLVAVTLGLALPLGAALGVAAARRAAWRGPVFGVLNVVQTVPSIALFGLLLPLLARAGLGIGVVPAVIALTLYALLPIARTTAEGLGGVAPAVRDAARGIGMRPAQVFWQVEVPLAWPSVLAGVRITAVQTIGLAVIAALIGAGGLGSLVFAGLSADALDLLLLGVIPTVGLALLADGALALLARTAAR